MKPKTTVYALEVSQLFGRYKDLNSLKNATPLDSFNSSTPFGSFNVGDDYCNGNAMKYFGKIEHIRHWVGDFGEDEILHKTVLYIVDEEA